MCLDCGCHRREPFGLKVLRALAPGLLQPKPAPAAPGSASCRAGSLPRQARDAELVERAHPAGMGAPPAAGSGVPTVASAEAADPAPQRTAPHIVDVHEALLADNNAAAARNRARFAAGRMLALNLVSSPGAGKTTLLSRTVDEFGLGHRCAVVVGDLETDNDARRIHRPHVPVAQITTGTACHLDAEMVARGIDALDLAGVRVFFIENVGNLVCPASFDLGETVRVVLLSATEGEDKPLKYPPIFKSAHLVLLTKIDVAAALGFDRAQAVENIRRIAPQAQLIQLSARTGEGINAWYQYLRDRIPGD